MRTLTPYPEYKESGLGWLPSVPRNWSVNKLNRLTPMTVGWTPPTGVDSSFVGPNLWANISDLGDKLLMDTAKNLSDEAVQIARIRRSPRGSLLYSFKLSVGQVSFAGTDMYTNEAIATFLGSEQLDLGYAYYSLPCFLIENASENIYGAKILNQERILATKVALPQMLDQQLIATFLDRETAEIDAFIADQEELIGLLAERRAATISHAVTKGLDPTVPMKDSGVEWIGEIPSSWVLSPLKVLATIQTGVTLGKEYEEGTEYPYLRVANVQVGYVDVADVKNVRVSESVAESSLLRVNDVLMTEGGDRDKLGRGAIWDAQIEPCLHQNHIFAVRCGRKSLIPAFLVYVLDSSPARAYFDSTAKQTTNLAATNSTIVKNFRFALPSVEEQLRLLDFLDNECAELDATIADAKDAIALSRERRAALISAAVTGKIDVREHGAVA